MSQDTITPVIEAIITDLEDRLYCETAYIRPGKYAPNWRDKDNPVCGAGVIVCPICRHGKLTYFRSEFNGHFGACCATENCVNFQE